MSEAKVTCRPLTQVIDPKGGFPTYHHIEDKGKHYAVMLGYKGKDERMVVTDVLAPHVKMTDKQKFDLSLHLSQL